MSKITNLIFNGAEHYITSGFGSRNPIKTNAGTSSNVHNGTDYGTHGKKIPQYAIEDGYVYSVGTDSAGAKYVTIIYPRINKRFLHWHLDSINVSKNQNVKRGTLIGNTGATGMATGVHLHLGIIDLSTNCYIDPEKYNYTEPSNDEFTPGNYKTLGTMNVRYGAGLNYGVKKVKELTHDGKRNATSTNLNANAVYKKGTIFTAKQIVKNGSSVWAKTPSGYVTIKGSSGTIYCSKVK